MTKQLHLLTVLLCTENLTTISAVMSSLIKGESNHTVFTGVCTLILEPVVSHASPWLVRHTPGKHTPSCISNIYNTVVSAK